MDYIFIRAWCAMMGSYPYYVRDQVDRAHQDDAPTHAIYWQGDGGTRSWRTMDDFNGSFQTMEQIERFVESNGSPEQKCEMKKLKREWEQRKEKAQAVAS